MIETVTFDFWDTIAIDDSDEPKRAGMGLPSKTEARIQLFVQGVTARHPHIRPVQAEEAYHIANQRFRERWHQEHWTPGITTRLADAYEHLGLQPEPGKYSRMMLEVNEIAREIEDMEVRIQPDFAPGIHSALQFLHQRYRLGIISDTIHTTGRGLRYLLQRQGLLRYFSHLIFSDEVGASKPDPQVFRRASEEMQTAPWAMVHIGDRESNDVVGPKSIGMNAILFTGIIDRGAETSQANAVCRTYAELPDVLNRISSLVVPTSTVRPLYTNGHA
jgi:putative hydrolase of the HAD superfamily